MGKVRDYINSLPFDEEYYAIFGHRVSLGHIYCPFHTNTDTPAAKYYPDSNCCYCFVCRRSYGTYDLMQTYEPEKIKDLKGSVIMEGESRAISRKRGDLFVSINRDDKIENIVKCIIDETGV